MKTIRLIIVGMAVAMGLTSCASLFHDAHDVRAEVLNGIQQGMDKREITRLLGTPEYRRFDRDVEEWEFVKSLNNEGRITLTHIVVCFEDGKVVAMDSFPAPRHPAQVVPGEVVIDAAGPVDVREMRPEAFGRFYKKVKSCPFKDEQLDMMRAIAPTQRLNCAQCASLMSLYTFDDDKMKVLRIFGPGIVDPENHEAILDVIDSLLKKDDAKKILGVRH